MQLENEVVCTHNFGSLPRVAVSWYGCRLCALVDSGAELCLISESALERMNVAKEVEIKKSGTCQLHGFSGKTHVVKETATLKVKLGAFNMEEGHDFAVVPDEVFPHCLLIGLDLLMRLKARLDFRGCRVWLGDVGIPYCVSENASAQVNIATAEGTVSHQLLPSIEGGSLRFAIVGPESTISGISMLTEDNVIRSIQKRCGELKTLYRMLKSDVPVKQWPKSLQSYRKHHDKLSIVNDVLVYGHTNVVVVPFKVCVDLAVVLHFNFAHIGRDKLNSLMTTLLWHPRRLTIVSDLCTTCVTCQLSKDYGTRVIPPSLKISTSYPFELLAVDLMSLPRTRSGFVACLVAVDHFSKFVAAVPLKNKQSQTVVEALSQRVLPFFAGNADMYSI